METQKNTQKPKKANLDQIPRALEYHSLISDAWKLTTYHLFLAHTNQQT